MDQGLIFEGFLGALAGRGQELDFGSRLIWAPDSLCESMKMCVLPQDWNIYLYILKGVRVIQGIVILHPWYWMYLSTLWVRRMGKMGRKTQIIPSNITIDTFTVISPLLVDGATHKYCALSGYSTDERYRTKNWQFAARSDYSSNKALSILPLLAVLQAVLYFCCQPELEGQVLISSCSLMFAI